VHQVGHGHPRVVQAVKDALDTLPFSPRRYTNEAAVALARRLVELAPAISARCCLRRAAPRQSAWR
jgi:4-aminobutyrate aminotransferase